MRRIRGKDTGPEHIVRRMLHAMGYRFRLHRRNLPGSPDIVMPGRQLAIFVHGCFWHRHEGCRRTTMPSTRQEFWQSKFARTVERDAEQLAALEALGWRTAVLWECEIRNGEQLRGRLAALMAETKLP